MFLLTQSSSPSPVATFTYVHAGASTLLDFSHHLEGYLPLFRQLCEFGFLYASRTDACFPKATEVFHSVVKIPLEPDGPRRAGTASALYGAALRSIGSVNDEPSAPPPPAVEAGPDTSLFDADPSLPSATLHIAPSATWMFDYFPMRMLRELPDGSCEAEMTYASEEWIARVVLGFGAAVRVLAPSSLGERVQRSASAALVAYGAAVASK